MAAVRGLCSRRHASRLSGAAQHRAATRRATPRAATRRRYIKWAQEAAAAAGSKGELQAVLEAATRALSESDRYYGDVRLLRIWVQYVSSSQQRILLPLPLLLLSLHAAA